MRILILGGTGMLGSRLWLELSKQHEVWATRGGGFLPAFLPKDRAFLFAFGNYDGYTKLKYAFHTVSPDVVINCIAVNRPNPKRLIDAIQANAEFPHEVMYMAHDYEARLIHFSTDGVFSGARGMYSEDDVPDASDFYGMTKRLGEIAHQKHVLTLRCCPIGRELGTQKSLVEWFLAQQGTVNGYQRAWFNGFTTHAVARWLNDYVLPRPDLHGVWHVSSNPINKYALLLKLQKAYEHWIPIEPDYSVVIDRTLDSTRFQKETGFEAPTWDEMIAEMVGDKVHEKVVYG